MPTFEVPTLALTLWPEWAWAIKSCAEIDDPAPKLVENRSWQPGARLPVGSRLAIHAGKHLGGRPGSGGVDDALYSVMGMWRRAHPTQRHDARWLVTMGLCARSAIVCTATIVGYDREQRTGWDVPGAWHWRLSDVEVLPEPVPCRGAQGLWTIPDDVRARLRPVT